jgi:HPt (histidine-containing phosphotransfer) domain-containing protein
MYADGPGSRLNIGIALEHVDGDRELLSELASMFVKDYSRLIDEADEAILRQDYSLLERAAHTLKGRVAFFGITGLRNRLEELERMGQEQDLSHAAGQLLEIKSEMQPILKEVELLIRAQS